MEEHQEKQIRSLHQMNPDRWNPAILAARLGVAFSEVLPICGERAEDYYQKAAVPLPTGKRLTRIRQKMRRSGLEKNLWVRCDGPRLMEIEQMAAGLAGQIMRLGVIRRVAYESNLYLIDQPERQAICLLAERVELLPIIRPAAQIKKYGVADFL